MYALAPLKLPYLHLLLLEKLFTALKVIAGLMFQVGYDCTSKVKLVVVVLSMQMLHVNNEKLILCFNPQIEGQSFILQLQFLFSPN